MYISREYEIDFVIFYIFSPLKAQGLLTVPPASVGTSSNLLMFIR